MTSSITRDELKAKLDRGDDLVIVEALPPIDYEDAHLPGALDLPHDQVDALAPRILPDKEREIVVYCSNTACKNSTIAANRLTALGYRNVRTYAEGKEDWVADGLPTESGSTVPAR
ncbi:MAG: rhodanese-like domain-containing protein [Chloroflexota bacterium]